MFAAYSLVLVWSALAPAGPVAPPAPGSALVGRWLLTLPAGFEYEADLEPGGEAGLYRLRCGALNLQGVYELRGHTLTLVEADTPVKLVVGLLLLLFASAELLPRFRGVSFGPRYLPLGGVLSGFFGGLSGMQGALRSAFLARAGLTKEAFVGTGVMVACLIDVSRLGVYADSLAAEGARLDYGLLAAAVGSAFVGAALGNRYLGKLTMQGVQRIVAVMLFVVALGLVGGLL